VSTPRPTQRRGRAIGKDTPVTQWDTHARLLRDVSNCPAPSSKSWRGRPDAIIVPATRPASALAGLIALAAELEVLLVVLCSRQAKVEQVIERVGRVPRARALVVDLENYCLPLPTFATSSPAFTGASGGRSSDLSMKRNFGLLLARLRGWHKIVFVDDDITLAKTDIARLTGQLHSNQIVAMLCRDFPDNSVFCHARRLAGLAQDVFVTGAVLGVNCNDLPLPFFPDIYNEDWFFFGDAAARHRMTKAGEAKQAAYEPFAEPMRAVHEEFGDLLAEGLYALIEGLGPGYSFRQVTHRANRRYWSNFIEVRLRDLAEVRGLLHNFTHRKDCSPRVGEAIKSLEAASRQYEDDLINADRCVPFLEAWQEDIAAWSGFLPRINSLRGIGGVMDWLDVKTWENVRHSRLGDAAH